MTEVAEMVAAINAADDKAKDACPFCYKKHKRKSWQEKSKKILSKPKQLNCSTVAGGGPGKYTTARHHLICAIQCFAQVKRLARMATSIGYDINDPPNGLGLPTIKNKYRAYPSDPLRKYSELEDGDKQRVANAMMDATGAQWHVGHHAVEITLPDEWDEDEGGDDAEYGHPSSYDATVVSRLIEIMDNWASDDQCKDDDDKSGLKDDLNDLSKKIKDKLQAFKAAPWKSKPYFVSERAFTYAVDRKGE